MLVSIEKMPGDARVWIYQSDRKFTPEEEQQLILLGQDFVNGWTAHQQDLRAGFEIRYHLFLILMIDEKQALASGCSIDKSVHFIQEIEKDFSVSLMNRFIFALKENNVVRLISKNEFTSMVEKGEIKNDTIVFNNLVQTKNELDSKWEIPFSNSWHKKVLV